MQIADIKTQAKRAVEIKNSSLALEICQALLADDVFIGTRAPTETSFRGDLARPLTYTGRCNACGETIPKDTIAIWIKGAGIWHVDCGSPLDHASF